MTDAQSPNSRFLKEEAEASSKEDFGLGYDCGKIWAADASFADIRTVWLSYLEANFPTHDRRPYAPDMFAFLKDGNSIFHDTSDAGFMEIIGYDDEAEPAINKDHFAAVFSRPSMTS